MIAIICLLVLISSSFGYGGPCDNVVIISTSWPGGYTVALSLSITSNINSWTIDLTFPAAISFLEVWNAQSTKTGTSTYRLSNLNYNGVQFAGTKLNSVGFNVRYPSANALPTISSVVFNGAQLCSSGPVPTTTQAPITTVSSATTAATVITTTAVPTTTTTAVPTSTTTAVPSTTTTAATTTTKPPTTASGPAPSCPNVAPVTNTWPGGFTIQSLNIPVPITVTSWNIDVTFSSAVSGISVWNAGVGTTNNMVFRLSNLNYNGALSAGTIFTSVGFNINYPSGNTVPIITSILFNNINVCSGVVPVTTTSVTAAASTTVFQTTTTTGGATTTTGTTTTGSPLNTKYNYAEVIQKSLLFYYAQRSGRLPANDNPIPYRSDSALGDVGQNLEDLSGGYYDAGDHVKFGFPMAGMTTIVAWSVIDYALGYSSAGQLTNARNMVKWASDYFIKAHVSAEELYGQVGDGNVDHAYWGRPEDMTMARPAFSISTTKPGSDLAGETAAALAATSIVFATVDPTYSANCLTHAQQLYTFAKTRQGSYSNSLPQGNSFYGSSGYGDELAWAAIWLYRATNDVTYLENAKSFYNQFGLSGAGEFSWDNKNAGVQVMLAKMTNDPTYINAIKTFCDSKVNQPKTPKGLLFISQWGSLRHASNVAYICLQAADLNISSLSYRQFAQKQIHYALGDTGRSFVVGFGVNPPVNPHHRSSSCPNKPSTCDWGTFHSTLPNAQVLYGALVGGPDSSDDYSDDRSNFVTNEVATDYNAGFQGAVAALQTLAVKGIFV